MESIEQRLVIYALHLRWLPNWIFTPQPASLLHGLMAAGEVNRTGGYDFKTLQNVDVQRWTQCHLVWHH